jgi:pantoate--beta-alanine ligase
VDVVGVTGRLEGTARPGHFKGVTTVVAKLFNIVQPTKAYFGQKDAQQATVIKKMVADLNMNLEVVTLPTVREIDGLAMSSRNVYLNPEERKVALVLYQSLSLVQQLWARGERNSKKLRQEMLTLIKKQPLANIDYISVANAETLDEVDNISPPVLVSMAVRIGKTRLIDNVLLE